MKNNVVCSVLFLLIAPIFIQAQNVSLLFHDYKPKQRMVAVKTPLYRATTVTGMGSLQPHRSTDNQAKFMKASDFKVEVSEAGEGYKSIIMSPAPTLVVNPDLSQSIDPHVAAGRNYLVMTNYDDIGFYDKNGALLARKAGGLETHLNADVFFAAFFDPINDLLGLSRKGAEYQINEFYDLRVIYDDNSRRFIIVSAARNQLWINSDNIPDNKEPFARRLVAFAVSKTEDPRDGFYQYMTTENNYRDWPRISINGNHLMIANNAADGMGSGPVAYVISMNDVKAGDPTPAAVKLKTDDFGYDRVNVVTNYDAPYT
ncbi:MAG: hypothetical protein V4722_00025 [Bacteroidota bacterium]